MIRSLLIVALLGFTATLTATPPMGASTPEELVTQLGDPDFATRERASRILLGRGAAAVPALRKALTSPGPEIRHRAQELLQAIRWKDAFEPKRVTIPAGTAKLGDAYDAIAIQTGAGLCLEGGGEEPGAYGIQNATFWEAMEHVARISGNVVVPDEECPTGVCLKAAKIRPPFICLDGVFHVQLDSIHEERDVCFTRPGVGTTLGQREHALTFKFPILAEPRLMLLDAEPVQSMEAVDERGREFSTVSPGPVRPPSLPQVGVPWLASNRFTVDGVLKRPEGATVARTLKGVIPVKVVVERRRIAVPKEVWSKPESPLKIGDDTLIVQSGAVGKDRDFHLTVRLPAPPKVDELHRWLDRIIVEDLWGNPLLRVSAPSGRTPNGYTLRLAYRMPVGWLNSVSPRVFIEDWVILRHRIKFQFHDVPLP